jgi:hypothetical protein
MRDHVYGNTFFRLKITKEIKSFSTLENGAYRITGNGVSRGRRRGMA